THTHRHIHKHTQTHTHKHKRTHTQTQTHTYTKTTAHTHKPPHTHSSLPPTHPSHTSHTQSLSQDKLLCNQGNGPSEHRRFSIKPDRFFTINRSSAPIPPFVCVCVCVCVCVYVCVCVSGGTSLGLYSCKHLWGNYILGT